MRLFQAFDLSVVEVAGTFESPCAALVGQPLQARLVLLEG
jgi:hypothetical protein